MSTLTAAWAGTDFPYQCLVDLRRTNAFRVALRATVRPGDVVVDAGSGSGILAFLAAEAGASTVFAVEMDEVLADCLSRSVAANHLTGIVRVLHGDVSSAPLPQDVDVFVCEMLDTGLLDETQALVTNRLRGRGVITDRTRLIPYRYETYAEFGGADLEYYGYRVLMPAHRWPHCDDEEAGWLPVAFRPYGPRTLAYAADFRSFVFTTVSKSLTFVASDHGEINAVRISGCAHLTPRTRLQATNAFNGDKVVPIDPFRVRRGQLVHARIDCELGAGLGSLHVAVS
jgi:SAM-dependent methyltransferase